MSSVDTKANLEALAAVMAELRGHMSDPFAIGRAVASRPALVLPRVVIASTNSRVVDMMLAGLAKGDVRQGFVADRPGIAGFIVLFRSVRKAPREN